MKKQLDELNSLFNTTEITCHEGINSLSQEQFDKIYKTIKDKKQDGVYPIDKKISLVLAEGSAIIIQKKNE